MTPEFKQPFREENDRTAKIAAIFPGQGGQRVGMGRDVYEHSKAAREIFRQAEVIFGEGFTDVCFNGPKQNLDTTDKAQPAVFTVSVATFEAAKEIDEKKFGKIDMVGGHSLGEYAALVASGAAGFKDAAELVLARALITYEESLRIPGGMATVIGLQRERVQEICESLGIDIAVFNLPNLSVVTGEIARIMEGIETFKKEGARKVNKLTISGAFHSPLMSAAAEKYGQIVSGKEVKDTLVPMFLNVTGLKAESGSEIQKMLTESLTKPVRWFDMLRNMVRAGVTEFYEFGPGGELSKMIGRADVKDIEPGGVKAFSVTDFASLQKIASLQDI
ncbi:ACP S-malonyltransferase [Patescibacteria group bacterium]|nr:ACP S-malonyltransferase [Patescibacteria group bacterium]